MKALLFFFIMLIPTVASYATSKPMLDELHSAKGSCGPTASGRPVAAAEWDKNGGHFRVHLNRQWIDVPDDALVAEPNRAGHAVVWPMAEPTGISIRCFMP
jgi:hypothetical protein